MPKADVSIYDFKEYHTFLKEAQGSLKKSNSKYSHRFIGEKVGASSALTNEPFECLLLRIPHSRIDTMTIPTTYSLLSNTS